MKRFVVKQADREFWQKEPPAFVFRATLSPKFGLRVFEQVAVFDTKVEADQWVTAQQKDHA